MVLTHGLSIWKQEQKQGLYLDPYIKLNLRLIKSQNVKLGTNL